MSTWEINSNFASSLIPSNALQVGTAQSQDGNRGEKTEDKQANDRADLSQMCLNVIADITSLSHAIHLFNNLSNIYSIQTFYQAPS